MAPKKLQKTIVAELKKKNTAEAENIVAKLKLASQKDITSISETAKAASSVVMETNFDFNETGKPNSSTVNPPETGRVTEHVKKPRKKTEKAIAAELKKKNKVEAEEIVAKLKRSSQSTINGQNMVSTSKTTKATVKTSSNSTKKVESNDGSTKSTSQRTKPVKVASSSKISDNGNSVAETGSSNGDAYQYQYEIDCKRVADSINVIDLQERLEKHLKVNGEKNNLGSTVLIRCEGQKVVVKSKTFLPKKALRFLSKKFLKKNWNIQVVSKNVHSYEYKYIGTL